MPILNYTTDVPVDRTMGHIQKALAKAGANAIMTEYAPDGMPAALTFRVPVNGEPLHFRLPADVDGVQRALKEDRVKHDRAHAQRVAWRILKDWIEAQMAIIDAQMAELPQVFLPYAQTVTGETVYERIKSGGFTMLEGPKK